MECLWQIVVRMCLLNSLMDKTKGTFWVSPQNISGNSANTYIYWQQAHAIDVVLYSYERIKDNNPILAATYKEYFERWFQNHGNNYHHDNNDPTGFSNPYTDVCVGWSDFVTNVRSVRR